MISFLGNISLLSLVIIPIAIIWIIIRLVRKKKLKPSLIALCVGFALAILGIGLSIAMGDTKLSLSSTHLKTNSTGMAVLKGKSNPGALVKISSDNTTFDETVKTDSHGNFEEEFDFNGGQKVHKYTVSATSKNRGASADKNVTVIDSTYASAKKARDKQESRDESATDSEYATKRESSSDSKVAFEKSVKVLAKNFSSRTNISGAVSVKFNSDDSEVTFYVPDGATELSKSDKRTIASYLFEHTKKIASLSDVDEPSLQYIQTRDYENIARTTMLGGIKVYE